MTTKRLSLNGTITYWTVGETHLPTLKRELLASEPGLEKIIPHASTPMNALRRALEDEYPNKLGKDEQRYLVRALEGNKGYAVVIEDRGTTRNVYEQLASAWFNGEEIETTGLTFERAQRVRTIFVRHRDVIEGATAGMFMGRVACEYFGGVTLRPKTGGLYWLPEDKAAQWQAIAQAAEKAGVNHCNSVYTIKHQMDEHAIRAVRDALIYEVSAEAERINADVLQGDLGEKALRSREREATTLLGKVERYEGLLDVTLKAVRKSIGDAKEAAAAAALLALAAQTKELEASAASS